MKKTITLVEKINNERYKDGTTMSWRGKDRA